jgi:hypothetical protein
MALSNIDTCPSEAKNENLFVRVLHDACVKLGGEHALAKYLKQDVSVIDAWLRGRGRPPDPVFLQCLDLLETG